jgi:hypothetical protein
VSAAFPRAPLLTRAAGALAIAFAVEFSQLYHAPGIDHLRATAIGHLVLGSDFYWRDLISYALGVGLAAMIDVYLPAPALRPSPNLRAAEPGTRRP